MSTEDIYISISLEADEDWHVADVAYRGVQWASMTFTSRGLEATIYGDPHDRLVIPVDDAIASLEQARDRLREIVGGDAPNPPDR